ncbi:MAG: hypothetical protein NTV84_00810 [Methanoregula sp.]|nr:hypothetical protein [Methanoregula sp.]
MLWMRERMEKGMVTGVFPVTFPVFAGPCFDRGFYVVIAPEVEQEEPVSGAFR